MDMPAPRILIVDDDPSVASLLDRALRAAGFTTTVVGDGLQVVPEVRRAEPALVLLDVMLPGRDGIAVCRELRQFSAVPVIMVTSLAEEGDRVLGLEVGADDYVCKQFSAREVVARVHAVLRRAAGRVAADRAQWVAGFRIDGGAQRIACGEQWLPLTAVEYRLLRQLLSRPGQVFSRAQLLDSVHGEASEATERAIDSHVKNLRRKIAAVREGDCIKAVYGVGYRLEP